MLASGGQVKYGALLEVIRKIVVGQRAVMSSGYIITPSPSNFLNVRSQKSICSRLWLENL